MERYLKRKEKLYILLIILSTIVVQLIFYAIADSFGYRAHLLNPGVVDNLVPFKTFFVYPYLFWIIMLIAVPYVIGLKDEKQFKKYIIAVYACSVISLLIFTIYPTIMQRPELIVNDFSDKLLSLSYRFSTPTKSAPSIHVALCTLFSLATLTSRKLNIFYKVIILLVSIIIIMSTMFVKQHYFIDVITGVGVGVISWLISCIKLKKEVKR